MSTGSRWRSVACECEVIVVRGDDQLAPLRCGGHAMVAVDQFRGPALAPVPGLDAGTLLGKRYTDTAGTLEVLCTRAGAGTLSIGTEPLELVAARQLPSSD